jgi:hypothetical protein
MSNSTFNNDSRRNSLADIPASLDTIDEMTKSEHQPLHKTSHHKTKLERRETTDSGISDLRNRNSVVSSSDVSIHSTNGGNNRVGERGRKLTLDRECDSLTPVTEV